MERVLLEPISILSRRLFILSNLCGQATRGYNPVRVTFPAKPLEQLQVRLEDVGVGTGDGDWWAERYCGLDGIFIPRPDWPVLQIPSTTSLGIFGVVSPSNRGCRWISKAGQECLTTLCFVPNHRMLQRPAKQTRVPTPPPRRSVLWTRRRLCHLSKSPLHPHL